jgi:mannose-6-phosphate isomerase
MKADYVLKFGRNLHPALWGCESWEVSVHPSGPSTIANGTLAGASLADVCPDFPLLIKVIDARSRLSVQVHPDEISAALTGGDPKTEMWCLLEAGFIYAGLDEGTTADDVAKAVELGSAEKLLVRHDGKKGDAFFIPGGMVHAIGDGAKLYEVQQNSDTTYRLYDWNRVDAAGKPRRLHIDESLKAMRADLPPPSPQKNVSCRFFDFRQLDVDGAFAIGALDGYTVLYAASGTVNADDIELQEGESALVPPGIGCTLRGKNAKVFVTRTVK